MREEKNKKIEKLKRDIAHSRSWFETYKELRERLYKDDNKFTLKELRWISDCMESSIENWEEYSPEEEEHIEELKQLDERLFDDNSTFNLKELELIDRCIEYVSEHTEEKIEWLQEQLERTKKITTVKELKESEFLSIFIKY